jgi:hypothetical protein
MNISILLQAGEYRVFDLLITRIRLLVISALRGSKFFNY